MKKFVTLLGILLLVSSLLAGCSSNSSSEGKKTVTIWSYGSDNVKTTFEKLAKAFNESDYGKKYQMKVEFISSGSNAQSLMDRTIAAKKAGKKDTNYDLIEVSDAELAAYQQEGGKDFFTKLDTSKIPNAKNVLAKMSVGQDILMPYRGTTVVLAYNSDKVKNPPKTAEELYQWIKEHKGKFAYNSPSTGGAGGSFVTTALYNKLPEEALVSQDKKWENQWSSGLDLLKELHPYLYQSGGKTVYPNKNQGALDLLANEQIDMTPAWVDQVVNEINTGILPKSTKMVQITPAFTGNLAALAIPKIGGNTDGAYAVMDFMVSEKAQTILLDEMGAFPVVDTKSIKSDNTKMISKFEISKFRTSSIGTLSVDLLKKWDDQIASLK